MSADDLATRGKATAERVAAEKRNNHAVQDIPIPPVKLEEAPDWALREPPLDDEPPPPPDDRGRSKHRDEKATDDAPVWTFIDGATFILDQPRHRPRPLGRRHRSAVGRRRITHDRRADGTGQNHTGRPADARTTRRRRRHRPRPASSRTAPQPGTAHVRWRYSRARRSRRLISRVARPAPMTCPSRSNHTSQVASHIRYRRSASESSGPRCSAAMRCLTSRCITTVVCCPWGRRAASASHPASTSRMNASPLLGNGGR